MNKLMGCLFSALALIGVAGFFAYKYYASRGSPEAAFDAAPMMVAASPPPGVRFVTASIGTDTPTGAQVPAAWEHRPFSSTWNHVGTGITLEFERDVGVSVGERLQHTQQYFTNMSAENAGYLPSARVSGLLPGGPAMRLDGTFSKDAQQLFARDYILFWGNNAYHIMVRGPVAQTALIQSVADYIAFTVPPLSP